MTEMAVFSVLSLGLEKLIGLLKLSVRHLIFLQDVSERWRFRGKILKNVFEVLAHNPVL